MAISELFSCTRTPDLNLDAVYTYEELGSVRSNEHALAILRGSIRRVASGEFSAAHFFFDELADVVRTCFWKSGTWFEELPLPGEFGRPSILRLRRALRVTERTHSSVSGTLGFTLARQIVTFECFSLHECDFRLFGDGPRPSHLPYAVVNWHSYQAARESTQ